MGDNPLLHQGVELVLAMRLPDRSYSANILAQSLSPLTDSMNLPQKVESGMESLDWNVSVVDTHLQKFLWVYCPGHAGVKGNEEADRLAGKATLSSGLLLGRSEVLRSLRHYLRAQSQGHHTRLEERGVERGSARRSYLP